MKILIKKGLTAKKLFALFITAFVISLPISSIAVLALLNNNNGAKPLSNNPTRNPSRPETNLPIFDGFRTYGHDYQHLRLLLDDHQAARPVT